jgi:ethanolamine permease
MYIISMMSLFKLRRTEPNLERPFDAPLYPFFPALAIIIAVVAFVLVAWYNQIVFLIYVIMMGLGYGYFLLSKKTRESVPEDDMLVSPQARS